MSGPLLTYVWTGTALQPLGRFAERARQYFTQGEYYVLEASEERSWQSHKHYFASIYDMWLNLPETAAMEPWAQSSEHLRKYALIKTGWHDSTTFPCATNAEAQRTAQVARSLTPADDYRIAVTRGDVVELYSAKSQSMKAMGKAAFQKSKDDVLGFLERIVKGEAA